VLAAYFSLYFPEKEQFLTDVILEFPKCVNVGNLMLLLPFGFNTVKLGSRMFFYNNTHRIKTINLTITGLGKVRKVLQISVFNMISHDGAM
jgi:hypothetical protein